MELCECRAVKILLLHVESPSAAAAADSGRYCTCSLMTTELILHNNWIECHRMARTKKSILYTFLLHLVSEKFPNCFRDGIFSDPWTPIAYWENNHFTRTTVTDLENLNFVQVSSFFHQTLIDFEFSRTGTKISLSQSAWNPTDCRNFHTSPQHTSVFLFV